MKKQTITACISLVVASTFQACVPQHTRMQESPGTQKTVDAKISGDLTGELERRNIRRARISLKLPKNTGEIKFIKGILGDIADEVSIDLLDLSSVKRFNPAFESRPLVRAELRIYSPKQEAFYQSDEYNSGWYLQYKGVNNRRIESFNKIYVLDTSLTDHLHYKQKLFRIDLKDEKTGRVCRATILRSEYSGPKRKAAEERAIREILNSIAFY